MNTFFEKNDATLSRDELKVIKGGRETASRAGKCCWAHDRSNCSGCVDYHNETCLGDAVFVYC